MGAALGCSKMNLTERLRERARSGYAHDELDEEAADEIERLRQVLEEIVKILGSLSAEL
jgi:hypothetical protein